MRNATISRRTAETRIDLALSLDERAPSAIRTGVRFLDHLLAQFAFHGGLTLRVETESFDGIMHHAIEDTAIVLGQACAQALGERAGIERYASETLAMDDALVRVALDLGGRIYTRCALDLRVERIEDMETSMIPHVFTSLAANARFTLHVDRLAGEEPHHITEAAFKALGRAFAVASSLSTRTSGVASTKGVLV
jgi:imidazoleglycerol-phosphate dehydratase